MTFSLDNLPPLRTGRSNLLAIPRPIALPCFLVPERRHAVILRDNRLTGTFKMYDGDWHLMPDMATHFVIPGEAMWDGRPSYRTGRECFELVDLKETGLHHRAGVTPLHTYWAGAEHFIDDLRWAVRQRPASVIGQIPAGAQAGRLETDADEWVAYEGGDYLVREGETLVRAIPELLMRVEFEGLVRRNPPRPHGGPRQEPEGELVVDFTASQDLPIDPR